MNDIHMDIKGVIFDLDGVIVHTDVYHYNAWKSIADKLGVYFDEEMNNALRGVSRSESLDILLKGYTGDISAAGKQALAEEKNAFYRSMLGNMTPEDVDNDVLTTIKLLKCQGYKLAIGSSSKNAAYILERTGLTPLFDAVSDGNNITKSKPSPEVFLKACEKLGLTPGECIVVEDAATGIQAAKAAGMPAAAVGDASRCPEADHIINSITDILYIVNTKSDVC